MATSKTIRDFQSWYNKSYNPPIAVSGTMSGGTKEALAGKGPDYAEKLLRDQQEALNHLEAAKSAELKSKIEECEKRQAENYEKQCNKRMWGGFFVGAALATIITLLAKAKKY